MRNRFAWFALMSFKFPEVDKLTDTNCGCKKFRFEKCVGRGKGNWGGGGMTIPIQVKISCLRMIKIVPSLM